MVVKKRQSINEAESLKVGDVVSVVGQRKPSVVLGVYPDAHAVKVTTVGNVDVDDVKKLSKSEVLSSIKRNLLLDLDVALLIQQGVISANQLDKDIDKDLLKRASKLMGEYNIPRLKESRIGRSKKALKEAINPEYDDGGYASFGIDISYEILDKNTQETIEQGEFYSSNEYILARTESELDIEYKMELRKAIGNNATYQNVLLSYQRPDRMSSYFLVEVDPEDYDLYFAEVEDNQEVSLTIRLTTFSHDEGMQIVGEDVTMDEIFMESQGKTNMRSKKALKESLITNGRKPISNLSINLFKEAQKKSRRKPIVEAGGDEIWNRVERAKEYLGGGDYLLDDFVKAMSNDAVEDILDYIERTNDIGYNEEQMESLVTERMKKVIKESKQPRHKSTMKESKKPLKESLCMPISGMEYMVYKKGVLGEGSGKVVVIGIATVNGENVTINGTKYNKSQYDFVGTKGY